MKLDEITRSQFKDELKHGPRYNVFVISRLGKSYEAKGLPYKEAKYVLNDLVGQYQSDVFPNDPYASLKWDKDGEGAMMIIPSHSDKEPDNKIGFYMEKDNRA